MPHASVDRVHRDVDLTPAVRDAVDREVRELTRWLWLELDLPWRRSPRAATAVRPLHA
jgi:hypothetical protein